MISIILEVEFYKVEIPFQDCLLLNKMFHIISKMILLKKW